MASLAQATRISSIMENSQHLNGNVDEINETLDLIKDVSKSWSDVMSKNFLQIFNELGMTKEKFPKFFKGKTDVEVVDVEVIGMPTSCRACTTKTEIKILPKT